MSIRKNPFNPFPIPFEFAENPLAVPLDGRDAITKFVWSKCSSGPVDSLCRVRRERWTDGQIEITSGRSCSCTLHKGSQYEVHPGPGNQSTARERWTYETPVARNVDPPAVAATMTWHELALLFNHVSGVEVS